MNNRFFNRIKYILEYPFYKIPKTLDEIQTVEYLIKNDCSVARFGDGELMCMLGKGIKFQEANQNLANMLKSVKTTEKCLVCIPNFYNFKNIKLSDKKFWVKNKIGFKKAWTKNFKKNKILGDTNFTRFYIRKVDASNVANYVAKLKELWEGKEIVFIEGEKTRMGVGNDLFANAKKIERILCPATNAFNKYNEIYNYVLSNVKKSKLLIFALGPTATVLAYNLSHEGFRCLDLGHVDVEYEWFLAGATQKVALKYKYVNEATNANGDNPLDVVELEYENQIVKKIL